MNLRKFMPVLAGLMVIVLAMLWYTGTYKTLFTNNISNQVGNSLALDLETLQITIRTVSSPLIEELQFVEAIDTLNAKESLKDLRNPFAKVYVAPPPELKPKPKAKTKAKTKKKTSRKSVKRKKRIVRPRITMTGIIWDRSNPYAILNGDIYGQGDVIQGYTVQTIQDTIIFLANNDDIFSIVIEE